MNGCTLPGRMISWAGAAAFGCTTETAVTATCAVSALRFLRVLTRDQIPDAKRPATTISTVAGASHRLRAGLSAALSCKAPERSSICLPLLVSGGIVTPNKLTLFLPLSLGRVPAGTLQNAEKCRHEEERRNRREKQPANDGTAQRSVLFPAVS